LLSELTRFAGVVVAPKRSSAIFRYIEFMTLSDKRILLIIVTPEGDVQNRVLFTDRTYRQSELTEAANFINRHYAGCAIEEIRSRLQNELKQLRHDMTTLMTAAIEAGDAAIRENSENVVVAGERKLLDVEDLSGNMNSLKKLFDLFERKTALLQLLELSRGYTITATPGVGFVFTNWTGSQTTNKPALSFLMASNLEFTANFVDVQRPSLTITTPIAGQRTSNGTIIVQGKAGDNWQVAAVFQKLNQNDWALASTTNGWTNWLADVTLTQTTNTVMAYAADTGGNFSLTNIITFLATNLPPEFRLALESARVNNSGEMELHFNISPDAGGQIEVSTNLVDWEFFANFTGTNQVIRFKDPGPATHHWRFYRGVAKRP
jgi:uncharacterized repeat protein (TIGR02543 family)